MTRTAFLLLSIGLCALSVESFSQYVIMYPYLFDPYTYSSPSMSTAYLQLPRPGDSYRSVRVRSLAEGFSGLISDPYTDHFRNPGIRVHDQPVEVFGDFGSMNDQGKFLFGAFGETPTGTLTGSVRLERLSKYTSSSTTTQPQPSPYTYEYSTEFSPEKAGGRLAYTWALPDEHSFGVSYEYLHDRYDNIYKSSSNSSSPGFMYITTRTEDYSQGGEVHVAGIGGVIQREKGSIALRGRGVFSSYTITNVYDYRQISGGFHTYTIINYPTDVKTKGFLAGVVFDSETDGGGKARFLVDLAYTSYEANGTITERYENGDSLNLSGNTKSGQHSTDGSIVDVLIGAGYEKRIIEGVTGVAGFSVNYVRNAGDYSERQTYAYFGTGTQPPPVTTALTSTIDLDGFDVRLPLGVEYFPFEHLTLRGGVEARYRSGEISTTQNSSVIFPPSPGPSTKYNVTQRGLSFAANFGIVAHHQDYGEVGVFFGKNLSDTTLWSFFLRYFV